MSATTGFGLQISEVRVQGFRALREVTVALGSGVTVLVGENNSGKTSFIDAVSTALGRRAPRMEDLQRTAAGAAKTFTIDLRVRPIDEEFPEGAAQVFGAAVQDVATDQPYVALRARGDLEEAYGEVRLTRWYLKGWDAAPPPLLQPRPSGVALRLLPFEYLGAQRDILEQLRNRSSLLGRTLTGSAFDADFRVDAEQRLNEIAELLRTRVSSLSQLRAHLQALRATLPNTVRRVEIDPVPQELEDLVRAVDIRVEDEAGSFSVSALGMGTRALAALLVFRTFVDMAQTSNENAASSASLAAFEEPEAHLHPQAQRAVVRALCEIPSQIIVSTHSGEIAGQVEVPDIRIFRRAEGAVTVRHVAPVLDPESEDGMKQRRFLLGRNAAALFARAVIVVEGETENAMLPILGDAWWARAGGAQAHGVDLVSSEGVGSARHIIPALEAWAVPWWLLVDGDASGLDTLRGLSDSVGRPLDETAPEVVVLAPRIEEYLLSLRGYRDLVFALGRSWPDESIEDWRNNLHGQKAKGNRVRDYQSAGWEDRVALDWLTAHKGTVGAPLARMITSTHERDGRPRLPPLIREVFERIDMKLDE